MSYPLRTAILGCGDFTHKHATILAGLPDEINLVGFCNRSIHKARAFSEQYTNGRAPIFADHHEMLENLDIDLLVISLPPYAHTDEVELAAQKGTHIFIEKPIALSSEKAWQMVDHVERAGIKSQVGFQLRFGGAVDWLRQMIISGQTGPIGLMSARYFCNSLHGPWWRQRHLSGGQIVEQVIHMVDLLRYIMGEPVTVFSRQENLFHKTVPDYTVEDVSVTLFSFDTGALGVIYATNGAIPNQWTNDFRVITQNITAEFSDSNHAHLVFTNKPGIPSENISLEKDNYQLEWLDLIHAIRSGENTRTPMREGAKTLDLALAAVRSAQERREINL